MHYQYCRSTNSFEALLNVEKDKFCTELPTDNTAVETLVYDEGGGNEGSDLPEEDDPSESDTVMKSMGLVLEYLAAISRGRGFSWPLMTKTIASSISCVVCSRKYAGSVYNLRVKLSSFNFQKKTYL